MTLWRERRDPESYLIKERAIQKCVVIYRSKEILDLVTRKSERLEDTARNWAPLMESDVKVLSRASRNLQRMQY